MFDDWKRRAIRWLEDNRGLVIVVFCLPASFLFDLALRLRNYVQRQLFSAPRLHENRVRDIQRHDQCHKIPVQLSDILSLDTSRMVVRVEPMVSVGEITSFLIPMGYTLAVTLEIADATCGGLALGVGMTTYSHRVGLYQETVMSYDMVMADGSLIHVTKDNEHSDLFYCLPWSHGSLGFCVALELAIIPVKPYIRLEYIPVHGQKKYCDEMRRLCGARDANAQLPDYLEATVFSANAAVITVGHFDDADTDQKRAQINCIARWYKPWWYKHVETYLTRNKPGVEYVPLRDYLLRHNRAIFWVLESMIPFGNHWLFRLLLGWACPVKPAFLKFTTTPGIRAMTFTKQVFQDIVLPMTVLEASIAKSEELFDTYPILIYPCRIYDHGQHKGQLRPPRADQMCPDANYGLFYDLGVYGVPGPVKRRQPYDAVYAMRAMEKFIRDSGGYSFLYADIFLDRREFEEMFDLTLYEKVRKKYKCEGAFPHLYDKVKPEIDVFAIGKQCALSSN